MKTFNVPKLYNGFCYYFKFTCSSLDKVIKLFTLHCLHPRYIETVGVDNIVQICTKNASNMKSTIR